MKKKIQPIPDGLICEYCGNKSENHHYEYPYWIEGSDGEIYCGDFCCDADTGVIDKARRMTYSEFLEDQSSDE
jgi:hypothetical protein